MGTRTRCSRSPTRSRSTSSITSTRAVVLVTPPIKKKCRSQATTPMPTTTSRTNPIALHLQATIMLMLSGNLVRIANAPASPSPRWRNGI